MDGAKPILKRVALAQCLPFFAVHFILAVRMTRGPVKTRSHGGLNSKKAADLVSRLAAKAGGPGWRMPTVSELETLQGSWSLPVKVENFMIGGHLAKETVCGRFQSEVSYCANRLVAIGPLGQHKHLEENSYIAELSSFLRLVRGPQQF